MTLVKRVNLEPAFVLHTRAFKETSLLVDLFTKNLGRINVVANGARKPKSPLRSVLTPTSLFAVSFSGKTELKNLNACELLNHYSLSMPVSFNSIIYVNELLIKATEKEDPHEEIFNQYQLLCEGLSGKKERIEIEVLLRSFELVLLQELGYGIDLSFESISGNKIKPKDKYMFDPSLGFTKVQTDSIKSNGIFLGEDILNFSSGDLTKEGSRLASKKIMRLALDRHLGNKSLNIRKYLSKE
jgi:DNA repair protein RecO (recombination protein O)